MEWREVAKWIEDNCHPSRRGDGWFGMAWRAGPGRPEVTLEVRAGQLDVPVVILVARLFASDRFDARTALAVNQRLSVGAVALDGEQLVLRHVLALATLTCVELERALRQLAGEAARLRNAYSRAPIDSQVFAHYAS